MTPDPYRKAYEKAIEDLAQISETFERLSTRKKLVENLVVALQPVFAATKDAVQGTESSASIETPQTVQEISAEEHEGARARWRLLLSRCPRPVAHRV